MTGLEPEVGAQYPAELSGGMMKRASLARAMALDPELLFLDEPTAGLDPASAGGVDELVRKLRDLFGLTIVMITHDLDLLWQVADRVAVLGEGTVQGIGSMAELSQMDNPAIRQFFDGPRGAQQAQAAAPRRTRRPPPGDRHRNQSELRWSAPSCSCSARADRRRAVAGLGRRASRRNTTSTWRSWTSRSPASTSMRRSSTTASTWARCAQIRSIRSNPERVNLLFAIERGTPIKRDSQAVLKTQGLTGIAYVELSGGTRASPPLRATRGNDYPLIRTKPSLGARLENVLTTVLAKLDSTSNNINAMLSDENRAAFKSALADIATVAHTIAARKDTIDAGHRQCRPHLRKHRASTAQLGPVIERIGRSADAIEKMGNEVARTSASAGKTVDAVGADVQRFGTETLPELEGLLEELSGAFHVVAAAHRADRTQSVRPAVRTQTGAGRTGRITHRSTQAMNIRPPVAAPLAALPCRRTGAGAGQRLQPSLRPKDAAQPAFYALDRARASSPAPMPRHAATVRCAHRR